MDAGVKEVYLVGKAWGKRGKRPRAQREGDPARASLPEGV